MVWRRCEKLESGSIVLLYRQNDGSHEGTTVESLMGGEDEGLAVPIFVGLKDPFSHFHGPLISM